MKTTAPGSVSTAEEPFDNYKNHPEHIPPAVPVQPTDFSQYAGSEAYAWHRFQVTKLRSLYAPMPDAQVAAMSAWARWSGIFVRGAS